MGYQTDENGNEKISKRGSALDVELKAEESKLQPLSRKLKLLTAGSILYTNIFFGCGYNTYGPVLTTMQNKYEVNDSTISRALTILTGCYMVGALSGGFIYNYINRQLAVATILTTMSAIMFLTPHCPTMALFFVSAGIMGFCCGSYDTAQFVWMMEMLQKDCPPFVQGQHFTYALGTILASLILAPFLDEEEDDETTITTLTTPTYRNGYNSSSDNDTLIYAVETSTLAEDEDNNKLFIPYTIIGCLVLSAACFHFMLFIFMRYRQPPPEISEDTENLDEKQSDTSSGIVICGKRIWSLPKIRMVILAAFFYAAYNGMEMSTFQFFPKFGQNSELGLSESDSTYVLTGMNIGFAVGRGIAIVAVFKIMPQLILYANIVIVLLANILLIGWASRSLATLWVSSVLFGLGISSMFGSFSAFIERYLNFTNFIGSLMIVCGSGMASIYPLIIGDSIEDNPVVLSYTAFFSIGLIIFAAASTGYITYKNKTRY